MYFELDIRPLLIVSIISQLVAVVLTASSGAATNQIVSSSVGSVGSSNAPNNNNGLQCQRITVPACQGLGYNMTAMPNSAGHTNQLEAELRTTKLLPLIESTCSNRVRFLLCSSVFPLCTPNVPRPVTACKQLCETVKSECESYAELMQLWPDFLNCDTLPQPEKHELCMQIPQEAIKPHSSMQTHPPSPQPQYQQQSQFYWPWSTWKMPAHLSKSIAPTAVCPLNFTADPLNAELCVPRCNHDAFHSTQQKKTAEGLILGLSAVCFVLTLFSLVTFWAEPTRFGYPERPVLFLCLCYNLFSVCYLERIVFHNSTRNLAMLEDTLAKISSHCTISPPCLASYITTSYLSLCAATWWLIFALCFFLSSHQKWSSEALEKKSGLFHVLAWVPPLAPPIAALLMERVRPNELTGMCTAFGFVEIPALVLLLLGIFFTVRASRSLHSLQQQIKPAFGHQRFSQIRKRFLIFSLLFFMPTIAGVITFSFERYIDSVPACSTHEDCAPPEQRTAWPTLIRIFFQLAGGTLTGMWVWSRKTCESYRSRLVATPNSSTTTKSIASLPKKHLHTNGKSANAALYSGINFHNIPIYNPNQLRV
ncbi:frizzled-3 [Eurosta solidaginis]|uniref:frizzled-3 n=1 Tax=Eurosta solidaginis TaxID=178769 RepID=UPI0035307D5B